jgi:hypothetical protein
MHAIFIRPETLDSDAPGGASFDHVLGMKYQRNIKILDLGNRMHQFNCTPKAGRQCISFLAKAGYEYVAHPAASKASLQWLTLSTKQRAPA